MTEREYIITNGSLIVANITHDMSYYPTSPAWVARYNEAIWLSKNGKYIEAKGLLVPLLNDTTISKKAEISELYGDIIYKSSGSIDDVIRIYERSLSFTPSSRVSTKIEYMRQSKDSKSESGSTYKSSSEAHKTVSGSREREAKKAELQEIARERDQYLNNSNFSQTKMRSELQKLIELSQSGSVGIIQDW